MPQVSRRQFLKSSAAVSAGFLGLRSLVSAAPPPTPQGGAGASPRAGFGPLVRDPEGVLDLPEGFRYRVISRVGDEMDDGLLVPGKPDGMGAFEGPDGSVLLIRNHEMVTDPVKWSGFGQGGERLDRIDRSRLYDPGTREAPTLGGTTTVVVDPVTLEVRRQFLSLGGTTYNCAGGVTPWGTWVTCEEYHANAGGEPGHQRPHGYAFEVPATAEVGLTEPVPLKAMGRFRREAVAVDPETGVVYQTEDRDDGIITRFIPKERGRLAEGGRLQALAVADRPSRDLRNWGGRAVRQGEDLEVAWIDLEEVDTDADDLRVRAFRAGAARFARTEGMWWSEDGVYFAATTGGPEQRGQLWLLAPEDEGGRLELFIEAGSGDLVCNADNLTVSPWGDVIVCEDRIGGGKNHLVGVAPEGAMYPLGLNRASGSEFAGSVFSPDGRVLFVNVQGDGVTLAITGPWDRAGGGGGGGAGVGGGAEPQS